MPKKNIQVNREKVEFVVVCLSRPRENELILSCRVAVVQRRQRNVPKICCFANLIKILAFLPFLFPLLS